MNGNLDIKAITGGLNSFFRRFHTLLFFLVVSGGLFVAILMLLAIINLSSTAASTSDQTIDGTFDEATIQRIDQDSNEQILPGSRESPFVE